MGIFLDHFSTVMDFLLRGLDVPDSRALGISVARVGGHLVLIGVHVFLGWFPQTMSGVSFHVLLDWSEYLFLLVRVPPNLVIANQSRSTCYLLIVQRQEGSRLLPLLGGVTPVDPRFLWDLELMKSAHDYNLVMGVPLLQRPSVAHSNVIVATSRSNHALLPPLLPSSPFTPALPPSSIVAPSSVAHGPRSLDPHHYHLPHLSSPTLAPPLFLCLLQPHHSSVVAAAIFLLCRRPHQHCPFSSFLRSLTPLPSLLSSCSSIAAHTYVVPFLCSPQPHPPQLSSPPSACRALAPPSPTSAATTQLRCQPRHRIATDAHLPIDLLQ
ncbi:hypothetical protein B296_00036743 [Ensete ventricosum]|uniref:Uncharacterized protein n=1 Tax=Ensete ventricosum TaxID=4639 RepID=A0A426ZBV6_ENSVE|nr:hypothetical protein B296_00036743 [Ensete ventricosum]